MTKRELFDRLEPFDDDIKIIFLDDKNYKFILNTYYSTNRPSNEGFIILSKNSNLQIEKTVKLIK